MLSLTWWARYWVSSIVLSRPIWFIKLGWPESQPRLVWWPSSNALAVHRTNSFVLNFNKIWYPPHSHGQWIIFCTCLVNPGPHQNISHNCVDSLTYFYQMVCAWYFLYIGSGLKRQMGEDDQRRLLPSACRFIDSNGCLMPREPSRKIRSAVPSWYRCQDSTVEIKGAALRSIERKVDSKWTGNTQR